MIDGVDELRVCDRAVAAMCGDLEAKASVDPRVRKILEDLRTLLERERATTRWIGVVTVASRYVALERLRPVAVSDLVDAAVRGADPAVIVEWLRASAA